MESTLGTYGFFSLSGFGADVVVVPNRDPPADGEVKREGGLGVGAGLVVGAGETLAWDVGVTPPKSDGTEPLPAPNRLPGGLLPNSDPRAGFLGASCFGASFT